MRKKSVTLSVLVSLVCAAVLGTFATDRGTQAQEYKGNGNGNGKTIVYFVRHGEDQVDLSNIGNGIFAEACSPCCGGDECCLEVLNPLGEMRATLLADWFQDTGITGTLTNVIASHKTRTRQTVKMIASDAGLTNDVDQTPDGVQQIPPFVAECDAGFESASSSKDPMIEELADLPLGSQVVVGAHSGTIYKIMDAIGIDTSDPVDFPRRPNGKVQGFNNLWIVSMKDGGEAELEEHLVLDFELAVQ